MSKKITLNWNQQQEPYISSVNTAHLVDRISHKDDIPGENGENITLVIVMLDRANLTKRLLSTLQTAVPEFKGQIILFDNGSQESELIEMENFINQCALPISWLKNSQNYGIGPARNRAIADVKTSWVIFLDNDIYFLSNLLEHLHYTYKKTGAHFINLPLLDNNERDIFCLGGVFSIENMGKSFCVSGASAYYSSSEHKSDTVLPKFFLSDFIYGGTCAIKLSTFKSLGCFDENLFIGFEDLDFSLRLFKEGYKIATGTALCLVHDHAKPEKKADKDYEGLRHQQDIIDNSCRYIEHKYNIKIPQTKDWLSQRRKSLGIEGYSEVNFPNFRHKKTKITVGLVVDARGWAFDRIADALMEQTDEHIEFVRVYSTDFNSIIELIIALQACDVIHFFWRMYLSHLENHAQNLVCCNKLGLDYESVVSDFLKNVVITTGIHDHHYFHDDYVQIKILELYAPVFYAINKKIAEAISSSGWISVAPKQIICDPVKITTMLAQSEKEFHETVIFGWAGNSKHGAYFFLQHPERLEYFDCKGLKNLIEPALHLLREKGLSYKFICYDSSVKKRPFEEMPAFYREVDIYLCGSKFEGTPMPVVEAMAAGALIVSTDVGIVSDIFGSLQKKYLVKEYSPQSFAKTIETLLSDKHLWQEISNENRQSAMAWSKEHTANNYNSFFKETYYQTEVNAHFATKKVSSFRYDVANYLKSAQHTPYSIVLLRKILKKLKNLMRVFY